MGEKQHLNPDDKLDWSRCKFEKIRILVRIFMGEKILITLKIYLER